MGQEIVYCSFCGERILESAFRAGKAVTILKKNYCPTCAKNVIAKGKPKEDRDASEQQAQALRPRTTRRLPQAETPSPRPRLSGPVIIALVIGVVVLVMLYVVLSRRGP